MELEAQLILTSENRMFANPRRMKLLAKIAEAGSISQAAKLAGISYKAAWDAVDDLNSRADKPLIERVVGGKGGGGARLTPMGDRLLKLYSLLAEIQDRALYALQDESVPLDSLLGAISQFSAQSSARNQYLARVASVQQQNLNDRIEIELESGLQLFAEVTHSSSSRLSLLPGREVMVMIKAPAVSVRLPAPEGLEQQISDSEFNRLPGIVSSYRCEAGNSEVVLQLSAGIEICAVLDSNFMQEEAVAIGQKLIVEVDPAQVLLATIRQ
ncbi:TOBE domain-containing protein [Amphritea sp. HPY]|uniref:TOBE domain-containing protein n=1 Tax=Amphritea sp. HPY TaxID=3421652 RepID=UPI003D7F0C18